MTQFVPAFSPVSRTGDGDVGHRSGFFYDFKAEEVVVRLWNRQEETIRIVEEQQSDDASSLENSLRKEELDPFLAPYPYDNHKKWISLTNHVTFRLARALSPDAALISSFSELIAEEKFLQKNVHRQYHAKIDETATGTSVESASSETVPDGGVDPETRLPKMTSVAGTAMRFHDIPKNSAIPRGATPAEVTRLALDKTPLFEVLLKEKFGGSTDDLLGELQVAFVAFLFGRVFDGFEQWKRLTHLLCSSATTAAALHPTLYADFISVLFFQTREIPEDFFLDIVTRENFLTSTLCSFFVNIDEAQVDADLKSKADKFKIYLTKKFSWNFEEDDLEDERPVVVELTENQLKMIP